MILSELPPLGPPVSQINRFRWSSKGAMMAGRGGVKNTSEAAYINTCIVSAKICSFVYAISLCTRLIMIISICATRYGSVLLHFFFFKWMRDSWVLFWWWKDMKQWTRLWHPAQTSPSPECLRLHFGTLCWCRALFEGIVEIANAACTPLEAQ